MALADGDYKKVRIKVIETLNADTGVGGLKETSAPPVITIEGEVKDESRNFMKQELPAIVVSILGKREEREPNDKIITKDFNIVLTVVCRAGKREKADDDCVKITARLEKVFREQTKTEEQFGGLPDLIDGGEGVLISWLEGSVFTTLLEDEMGKYYEVIGEVMGTISVPATFSYE